MKFFFATSACSKETYKKIFFMRKKKVIDPAQKFFEQIISGVALNENDGVVVFSAPPVSSTMVKKIFFLSNKEYDGNILFKYPSFINLKILRSICVFFSTFFSSLFYFFKEKNEIIVICDPLCLEVSKALRFAAILFRKKTIAIVTDVPTWATNMKKHKRSLLYEFLQKKYQSLCMKEVIAYDGYINLTKYMNKIVNPNKKTSMVLEGSVDFFSTKENPILEKKKKIIMYAGGVYEKYGMKLLVNGFIKAKLKDVELHIYGDGSFVEKIQELSKRYNNIKYKGVVLNTELPQIESSASLLVNPRFSNEEYTAYSFPSKTLEYMSSGTPLLSTRLKGIPDDYGPYVYWLNDESENGMALKLCEIFKQKDCEFVNFGKKAKNFVLLEKNNIAQGFRIIEFAKRVVG